jgi:2-iminoacetate synthase
MLYSDYLRRPNQSESPLLQEFKRLLEPWDNAAFDRYSRASITLTRRAFGRTMRLFAPLYLSNECINNCRYCGFSRDNEVLRVTLLPNEVEQEARYLFGQGFRSLLLVSGEHPKFVSIEYLREVIIRLGKFVPSLSIEVAPFETDAYSRLVAAGAEGLVVYQETYDRERYAALHVSGPKRDFDWRIDTPERGYQAGFRRLGVGALFGLSDWRLEAYGLASHVEYLLRHCWRAQLTVSLPRLRPAAGDFQAPASLSDRDFVQLLCAFRLSFPQVGIVISTRETAQFRDLIAPLGVTAMSAGSRTEPGGYTGQGEHALHLTVRGRPKACSTVNQHAEAQFAIDDSRSPSEVAQSLRTRGLEVVWKDWESCILTT